MIVVPASKVNESDENSCYDGGCGVLNTMHVAKKKIRRIARAKSNRKSAVEALTERFGALIEEQAAKMNDEEFRAAENNFNQVIERVRASRSARPDKG